jgi:hypothetical protein
MRRTDLDDTSPEASKRLVQRLRELTPDERLRMTFDRIEAMRTLRLHTGHLRFREPKPR